MTFPWVNVAFIHCLYLLCQGTVCKIQSPRAQTLDCAAHLLPLPSFNGNTHSGLRAQKMTSSTTSVSTSPSHSEVPINAPIQKNCLTTQGSQYCFYLTLVILNYQPQLPAACVSTQCFFSRSNCTLKSRHILNAVPLSTGATERCKLFTVRTRWSQTFFYRFF